jgi:hypothetical protein
MYFLIMIAGFIVILNIIDFPLHYELYIQYMIEQITYLVYNIIYVFSLCQIYVNKLKNMINPYIKKCLFK